jgi:hypothetical protein
MTNYIYEKIDILTIDHDLFEIYQDQKNFTQSFELGEKLDYSINPNMAFFKVYNQENLLMGYIWFQHEETELGSNENLDEIEISIARSVSLASKGVDKKLFIDKIFSDLAHIRCLLPENWFTNSKKLWVCKIEMDKKIADESYHNGKSYIQEKLVSHGFQHNSIYDVYEKNIT